MSERHLPDGKSAIEPGDTATAVEPTPSNPLEDSREPIEGLETVTGVEPSEADQSLADSGSHALAVATEGGPVVAEVELTPLALRPQLPPSMAEDADAAPRVGFCGRYRLFILTVVLPMVIGALYLAGIAAPRFASSASFIVRSTDPQSVTDALTSVVQQQGASTIAHDETYAINAYMTSRDLVDQLAKNDNLRAILSRPEGDFLYRYPTFWLPDDNEFLYRRFEWMASATVDSFTSISTIEVNAFRPEDAQALVKAMLGYAEALVNQMNMRTYEDGLAIANRFVAEAQKEVDAVEAELQAYRNVSGSVDPNLVAQSKLQVIQGLSGQLAQIEAAIAQQRAIAPISPNLAGLRAQAQYLNGEIEKRKLEIAGSTGSEAVKLQTYEQLILRRELAAKELAAAVAQRDQARQDSERQHLFIQLITQPNLSRDFAGYPRVAFDLLALLALCLAVFQVMRKLGQVASEHRP